jgi:CRISPR/Cas system-associated endoribonuclease Cas2
MMSRILFFLIFFWLPHFLSAQSEPVEEIRLSGHITDRAGEPVAFATISIADSGRGVVSDENGFFFIRFEAADTLILSSVAHQPQSLYFGDTATANNYDLQIRLSEQQYELDNVTVFAFRDEAAFKRAILALDELPEEEPEVIIPGAYQGEKREVKPGISSPVSYMFSLFSKRARYEREARRKIEESRRRAKNRPKYNRELVARVTGLPDEQVDDFMIYCRIGDEFVERSNEYEIIMAINQCYKGFRGSN